MWKTGEPSERTMTKSCVSSAFFFMRPFTRSVYSMTPSFGMRKRTTSPDFFSPVAGSVDSLTAL